MNPPISAIKYKSENSFQFEPVGYCEREYIQTEEINKNLGEIKYNPHENVYSDEPELNPDFIEEICNTNKQKSILVKNLDDLFR